ncbi:MAG TPA: GH3 auxin-responsive promoter family protein, partial [Cytophagales bacterium]|nr:GH3 auxin-responsive promoter family protein [Cytophagales bacterium]
MAIIGSLLQRGIKLGKSIEQEKKSPFSLQRKELKKLLKKAEFTHFGLKYNFTDTLKSLTLFSKLKQTNKKEFYALFQKNVPIYNYNKIYDEWWKLCLEGEEDVCWPGKVKYFALSSGTSESTSKHIPITSSMVKAIRRTGLRQILALKNYNFKPEVFEKGILMLGGSTKLNDKGHYFEGDLSGISAAKIPLWFNSFYKPGKKIASEQDWNKKLDEITLAAKDWVIAFVVGVPAWIQIMMERIIKHYNVQTIHDIWPNLSGFCHGGVAFEPYKKGFEKLLARPIQYIETYLASEGFIAFQVKPENKSMRLMLNGGIFFEFVPFKSDNFDEDGNLRDQVQTFMIDEVEENRDYALLLSTCAGTWRYLIGDTIKFVNKSECEIVITGRTKHYLSLCGEHLSVENMNRAVELVSEEFNIAIREFAVAGVPYDTLFAHEWYIGTDDQVDEKALALRIDEHLKKLNDDYVTERMHALKDISVKVLPVNAFYEWLRVKGKEGGQNKFPRVLKRAQYT